MTLDKKEVVVSGNGRFWTAIIVLALLNVFTLVYLFQSNGSTAGLISSLHNKTSSIDSSLTSYMTRQGEANSELKSTIKNASAASDRKINSLGGRLDQANAQIQALASSLEAIDAESAAKYESLSGKITGLENLSKELDVEKIKNAVVAIHDSKGVLASGTIVSSNGYILTNDHVVKDIKDMNTARVELFGGKKYRVELITRNDVTDLALLRITDRVSNLSYLTFEDIKNIETGDKVYAIGNPLGEELTKFTVTEGIISGFRIEDGVDLIQTDAALNPGNSGGPIVNKAGKVVGIVSMGYVGAEGLSFGIRSDVVQKFLNKELP
jgi:S1-C subfamily serine protease